MGFLWVDGVNWQYYWKRLGRGLPVSKSHSGGPLLRPLAGSLKAIQNPNKTFTPVLSTVVGVGCCIFTTKATSSKQYHAGYTQGVVTWACSTTWDKVTRWEAHSHLKIIWVLTKPSKIPDTQESRYSLYLHCALITLT